MAKLVTGDFKEIEMEARKFIALMDTIPEHAIMDDSNRDDLHYMALKLERAITKNREDADKRNEPY